MSTSPENSADNNQQPASSETTGYRADFANSVIKDDIYDRRIFHLHLGHRYVNFSAIDKITAVTWENEMTQFYIQRAYTRNTQNCHHPMLSSLYNQILAGLWVIKVNIECGTATDDESAFWSRISRMIQFESLAMHPQMYALLSTIQPHIPKDDRFGRITPKMWTDVRRHPLTGANNHLAPGIFKYLNPDYHGIFSGCRRLVQGISAQRGLQDFTFFWDLDSDAAMPAAGAANLAQHQLNEAVGSARHREFGLIPGYGTYRPDDGKAWTQMTRRTLMDYVNELRLPQPVNANNTTSITGMFFMDDNAKWLYNLSNHMTDALSFYGDRYVFSDLKVTDDSNIALEMVNTTVPDFKNAFNNEAIDLAFVPAVVQALPIWIAAAPATYNDLNQFATNNPGQGVLKPDYIWAARLRNQLFNQVSEHRTFTREKDVPQIHKKNNFIYGLYAPIQTMDHYIGFDETTEGEFFNNLHNPRRYSYEPEDPSRVIKQVLNTKLFSRSQDAKISPYHK